MFGGRFGLTEILVILAVVLVLFGARRLPEIGSGLGKAIRSFKDGLGVSPETDRCIHDQRTWSGPEKCEALL